MPWYDRYFFPIFYTGVAVIIGLSVGSYFKKPKPKKANFKVEIKYKDTIK
jgi:hypothetical protein